MSSSIIGRTSSVDSVFSWILALINPLIGSNVRLQVLLKICFSWSYSVWLIIFLLNVSWSQHSWTFFLVCTVIIFSPIIACHVISSYKMADIQEILCSISDIYPFSCFSWIFLWIRLNSSFEEDSIFYPFFKIVLWYGNLAIFRYKTVPACSSLKLSVVVNWKLCKTDFVYIVDYRAEYCNPYVEW